MVDVQVRIEDQIDVVGPEAVRAERPAQLVLLQRQARVDDDADAGGRQQRQLDE